MTSSFVIAVASGKGGTGKTTVAVHLAAALSNFHTVSLIDLDVEAPDARGYFPRAHADRPPAPVTLSVPRLDSNRCVGCGACAKACRFGAIVAIGGVVGIEDAVCKGCGRCVATCAEGALQEATIRVGSVTEYKAEGLRILEGLLSVGDIRSTAVIEAVKDASAGLGSCSQHANEPWTEIQIRDCPPGVSCPAVHALAGADYVLLVAEPTNFSLHDLGAAVRMAKSQGTPVGVFLNKDGFGNADVDAFAAKQGIPVVGRLSFSRSRARAGARGSLWNDDPEASEEFERVGRRILDAAQGRPE